MTARKILLISGLAIILILIWKTNPSLFPQKKTGSFVYVRKAESLLEKGRFKEAIAYFKKAFVHSPHNDDIRRNLAWAYTKYGMTLAGSGDDDAAIEAFIKANETKPDTHTAQNLAIAYSRRAASNARRSDWPRMIDDLAAARGLVEEYPEASRNLAVSLYNQAVDEYNSGRRNTAILYLKEAALLHDDSRILDLIGEMCYKDAELDKALFYWERAVALNLDDKTIAVKLERLKKEIELAGREEKISSPHFDIRYEKSIAVDTGRFNKMLEDAYFSVGKDLEYFPPSRTVVYLYSEDDFKNIFKLPAIVRAFYDGNIRMPYPRQAMKEEELKGYIRHEYTHAVISAKTKNNCPVWFGEGIAMWEEYRGADQAVKDLFLKAKPEEDISIADLATAFAADERAATKATKLRTYYLLAYTLVNYIIDNWGLEGLKDILKRVADGQHIVNAIDDEFLLSEKEFTGRWQGYVRKRYLKSEGLD